MTSTVIDAQQTAEIQVESIAELAQFITGQGSNPGHVNPIVHVSDVTTPILQVQDAINNGTIIQVSDSSVQPVVQVADQGQGVFITEGMPGGIQILDSSFPFAQSGDGTSIIQLAPSLVSGAGEGLTQVVQLPGGQIALIEQQENIDPQNVQHFVFEQVPLQQSQLEGEMQQQQQQLMDTATPIHIMRKDAVIVEETQPPIGKGPFTCDICEKKLEKWNQYQRHLRTHEDDKPFRCPHCTSSYNIADNLKLHLATHIEPGDKPQCPECHKKFARVASLKAHIMLHEKEESLMCQECGDEFGLQSQLDRHMIEHREYNEGTRTYSCRQCNAEFTSQKSLKEHTKQHYKVKSSLSHKSYKKEIDRSAFSHKCSHCWKSFQKPSQLLRHNRVHTGDRPFKCNICTKAFNQKGALQIHILGRHSEKKPHICQFCNVGFSQKGNLRAHIQRVHTLSEGNAEGPIYSCQECPCVFKKLGSLNAHISRFHTELEIKQEPSSFNKGLNKKSLQKPNNGSGDSAGDVIQQLLDLSEAGSTQQQQESTEQQSEDSEDILQQALQNSGLPGGEEGDKRAGRPERGGVKTWMTVRDSATGAVKKHCVRKLGNQTWHQCTFCTKEFKKPSDLVRHTRIHSHERPYKCTQCFRAFAVKSTLNSHIRTHTGIKHFKCSVCEKSFSTHGSLKVHLRLHTGAKPYDCPHCDKKFRTAAHRKSHLSSHFKNPERKDVRGPMSVRRAALRDANLPDIPLQEPILITDTGLIQQPPRSTMFDQYLGESSSVDRPYKCGHCQRGFKKSSHLKQHVRSHTGERPYKCLQCHRTFVSNGVLKSHIRIHTGMKQYKCVMCDNKFSTNGSLKRHMSTHSDVRPFMCPYCQRTFKTNVNCKKHMKTHRHELAMQNMQRQMQNQPNSSELQQTEETQIVQETEYVEEEAVDNDLTLVQQELQTAQAGIPQADLTQQTILAQAGLQDALGLNTTTIDQQLLNQQMFGQQQSFTQSLLGSGQQNFQSMNSHMAALNHQTQFTIQQQPQQLNQIDLNTFSQPAVQQTVQTITELEESGAIPGQATVADGSHTGQADGQVLSGDEGIQADQLTAGTSLPSTSMQNILETRELQDEDYSANEVEEEGEVEQSSNQTHQEEFGKIHPCQYCNKVYKKVSHLKQHIRSHTGEKPYKCSRCEKTFVSKGVVRQHLRTHMGIKEYKCNVCSAMFTTNGSLTRHMNIHVTVKPYKCPYCLEAFRTATICKRHMKTHTGGRVGTDNEDEDGEDVQEHQEQSKPDETPATVVAPHTLAKATTGAQQDVTLSERILIESASERERVSEVKELTIQQEDRHQHVCTYCPKSFKKPSDLVRHTRIHTGEKPFACGICGRTFTVKSTLDSHMKTHGGMEKSIKCHVCNSLFSTKGSLKVHMRLHTGAKPFRCPHCIQRFRTSGHRKSHILSHYKPESTGRKRRTLLNTNPNTISLEEVPTNQPLDFINTVDATAQQTGQPVVDQTGQAGQVSQVINIDPSMLQGQNVLPLSVTVDNFGNLTESAMAAQVLQGLDGLQLHLAGSGNVAQGIQITGLDPSMFNQTLQIDASLLQQLQTGNVNLTFSSNQIQAADPNLVQSLGNIQVQPIAMQDGINPNMVVQPISMDATTVAGTQQGLQTQIGTAQEVAPSSFVVAADGSIAEQQMVQTEAVEVGSTSTQGHISTGGVNNLVTISNNTTGESNVINVVNSGVNSIPTSVMGVGNSMHGVSGEMDHETGAITAIDPNMTGITGDIMNDSQVSHGNDSDNEDMDDDIVQETVDDSMQEDLHDDRLMRAQDADGTFVQINNERKHLCVLCGKTFKRSSHLKEHMRVHSKDPKGNKYQNHKCPFCDKTFGKPSQMDRHLRIHTGERPFACSICNKSFNQKNALQMHLKKHSGEKPHKCMYCHMCFTQKGNLKTHIKRAHHNEMVSSMNLNKMMGKDEENDGDNEEGNLEEEVQEVSQEELSLVEVADLFNN